MHAFGLPPQISRNDAEAARHLAAKTTNVDAERRRARLPAGGRRRPTA
jgi:hypothetical protein